MTHTPSDQPYPQGQQVPPAGQPPYGSPAPQAGQPQPPYGQPPQGHAQGPYPGAGPVPLSEAEGRQWGSLAHLLGGILGFLAPLIVWAVYKERSPLVEAEAKKALNFQLLLLIGQVVSWILMVVLIGFFTSIALAVVSIVYGILNFQAVSAGRPSKYPVEVTFVK